MNQREPEHVQPEKHCCECYQKEIEFQRESMSETGVVTRAVDACENTGEGAFAAQSYLAAFFKREESKLGTGALVMPKWDTK